MHCCRQRGKPAQLGAAGCMRADGSSKGGAGGVARAARAALVAQPGDLPVGSCTLQLHPNTRQRTQPSAALTVGVPRQCLRGVGVCGRGGILNFAQTAIGGAGQRLSHCWCAVCAAHTSSPLLEHLQPDLVP